jgi:chitodextrinase
MNVQHIVIYYIGLIFIIARNNIVLKMDTKVKAIVILILSAVLSGLIYKKISSKQNESQNQLPGIAPEMPVGPEISVETVADTTAQIRLSFKNTRYISGNGMYPINVNGQPSNVGTRKLSDNVYLMNIDSLKGQTAYVVFIDSYNISGTIVPASNVLKFATLCKSKAPNECRMAPDGSMYGPGNPDPNVKEFPFYLENDGCGCMPVSDTLKMQICQSQHVGRQVKIENGQCVAVPVPPEKVIGVRAINVVSNMITLAWSDKYNVPVVSYNVYRNGSHIATVDVANYTDMKLSQNTIYNYTVEAVNEIGPGPISDTMSVQTTYLPKTAEQCSAIMDGLFPRSVSENGADCVPSSIAQRNSVCVANDSHTMYDAKTQSCIADTSTYTLPDAPKVSVINKSASQINVAVSAGSFGYPLRTKYNIVITRVPQGDSEVVATKTVNVSGTNQAVLFDDLLPNRTYTIVAKIGDDGPFGTPITQITDPGTPDAPAAALQSNGVNHIVLSIEAPQMTGGVPITNYSIKVLEKNPSNIYVLSNSINMPYADTKTYSITSLKEYQDYQFLISAVNSANLSGAPTIVVANTAVPVLRAPVYTAADVDYSVRQASVNNTILTLKLKRLVDPNTFSSWKLGNYTVNVVISNSKRSISMGNLDLTGIAVGSWSSFELSTQLVYNADFGDIKATLVANLSGSVMNNGIPVQLQASSGKIAMPLGIKDLQISCANTPAGETRPPAQWVQDPWGFCREKTYEEKVNSCPEGSAYDHNANDCIKCSSIVSQGAYQVPIRKYDSATKACIPTTEDERQAFCESTDGSFYPRGFNELTTTCSRPDNGRYYEQQNNLDYRYAPENITTAVSAKRSAAACINECELGKNGNSGCLGVVYDSNSGQCSIITGNLSLPLDVSRAPIKNTANNIKSYVRTNNNWLSGFWCRGYQEIETMATSTARVGAFAQQVRTCLTWTPPVDSVRIELAAKPGLFLTLMNTIGNLPMVSFQPYVDDPRQVWNWRADQAIENKAVANFVLGSRGHWNNACGTIIWGTVLDVDAYFMFGHPAQKWIFDPATGMILTDCRNGPLNYGPWPGTFAMFYNVDGAAKIINLAEFNDPATRLALMESTTSANPYRMVLKKA